MAEYGSERLVDPPPNSRRHLIIRPLKQSFHCWEIKVHHAELVRLAKLGAIFRGAKGEQARKFRKSCCKFQSRSLIRLLHWAASGISLDEVIEVEAESPSESITDIVEYPSDEMGFIRPEIIIHPCERLRRDDCLNQLSDVFTPNMFFHL